MPLHNEPAAEPRAKAEPKDIPDTDKEEECDLPAPEATGEICPPDLVNIWRDIRDGNLATEAQCDVLRDQTRLKRDRKAFIGACVDALLDCYHAKRIKECHAITDALYRVWGRACGYDEADSVVTDKTADNFPVRVWCDFYRRYKA